MRKWLKRMLVVALVLAGAYLVGRAGLSYSIQGYRPYAGRLSPHYMRRAIRDFSGAPTPNGPAVADFALAKTSSALHFAWRRNAEHNPDRILAQRAAHCKMYAYVFAALHNQFCAAAGIPARARVAYGQVYWYGLHLNPLLPGRFFQDHDFCVVRDASGQHAIDPVLFDYTFVRQVALRP